MACRCHRPTAVFRRDLISVRKMVETTPGGLSLATQIL